MSVTIREAITDDINELIEFGKTTFTLTFGHLYPEEDLNNYLNESYSNDKFLKYINDNKYITYVAINNDNNNIVGYIIGSKGVDLPHDDITDNCYEIIKLYIAQDIFGKGISQMLMDKIMEWFQSFNDRNDLWLSVWSENYRAQKFYQRYGFEFSKEYGYIVGKCVDREFIYRRKNDNKIIE